MNNLKIISINQIQEALKWHQKRLLMGDDILTMSKLAETAGISRQTLYKFIKGERAEFGQVAQIRLSRMLMRVSEEPSYMQTSIARVELKSGTPKIRFGV
jgi:predicted transcriptional regulator